MINSIFMKFFVVIRRYFGDSRNFQVVMIQVVMKSEIADIPGGVG